jgi:hypothetical protein
MSKWFSGTKILKCNMLLSPNMQLTNPSYCCTIYYTNLVTKTQGSRYMVNVKTVSYFGGDSTYLINSIECNGDFYAEDDYTLQNKLNNDSWALSFDIIAPDFEPEYWHYTEKE